MISIMFLAVLLDRPAVALRNVALAALLILVIYPESLIDAGFQMSFAAVVALVAVYEMIRDREAPGPGGSGPSMTRSGLLFFGGILLSTLIAGLAVAPLAAFHFHKSQQYAMIANLIAIPICNVLVMPAALAALVAMPFGLEAWPLLIMGAGIEGMVWCASAVAGLPGAVGRIPEIPVAAFGCMVAGGLWLCLWRTRWRYAGALAVLVGLLIAPFRSVPDVMIGRDGLVAVRDRNGLLSALGTRTQTFDLARMLEHDGDGRRPEDVARGTAYRCDWSGCVAGIDGSLVAVARHAAALADDCRRAILIVVPAGRAGPCPEGVLVIDRPAILRAGALAIRLSQKAATAPGQPNAAPPAQRTLEVVTVSGSRGVRPWSGARPQPAGGPGGGPGADPTGSGNTPSVQTPSVQAPQPSRPADPDDDP